MKRYRLLITGIVQGVGFRPFIYNLATQFDLKGLVGNTDSSVVIEIETDEETVLSFINSIKSHAPYLSKIESIECQELPITGFTDFHINESTSFSKGSIFISPDVGTCSDCVSELKNPEDKRYIYPFINCTNCGPRFTIIKDIPYDRDKTTMSYFEMCSSCRLEYTNPADRRYHAQPVSCHHCGPALGVADEEGKAVAGPISSQQCVSFISDIIKAGKIAAIKGIGGYHLACDALNHTAVNRLRSRKHRDDKPFALMLKNLDTVKKYCEISQTEEKLLNSPANPIVLLKKRSEAEFPDEIAHLNSYLGIMLPYTPIHHILFNDQSFPEAVVMTSGNLSSEPIFYKDEEAIQGLVGIADAFLTNNRDIYIRTDDSVTRVFNNREYLIRRSRGYVPKPIKLDTHKLLNIEKTALIPSVLACGGELKNVFCLNKGNLFYLSHHIGDLENESTNRAFVNAVEHFKRLFDISTDTIAHDLHPGYFSTQYALEQKLESKAAIQHHKAHIAACMAENGLSGQVIGVSFDGTGYGEDGKIWGGEFFIGGYYGFERVGRLQYVMMPGSDSAVKHPWKMALGYLHAAGKTEMVRAHNDSCCRNSNLLAGIGQHDIDFTLKMLEKRLNCPETSSMGRFFDAVSALLSIKTDISYEGQAAIELEFYAKDSAAKPYSVMLEEAEASGFAINTAVITNELIEDLLSLQSLEYMASRFHATVAEIVLKGCLQIRENTNLNRIALSGGVFQNITLLKMTFDLLKEHNFEVYTHSEVPANDGGIALGQAVMAIANLVGRA